MTTKNERLDAILLLSLRPDSDKLTDEFIDRYMAEFDAGLHPLSDEDKAAVEYFKRQGHWHC